MHMKAYTQSHPYLHVIFKQKQALCTPPTERETRAETALTVESAADVVSKINGEVSESFDSTQRKRRCSMERVDKTVARPK